MNIEQKIHERIGVMAVHAITLEAQIVAAFVALDECIRSGQVPDEDVPRLVASVPGFAQWRASKAD